MANIPCPVQIPTLLCPGSDAPVSNFSSELPDQLYFVGVGYTPYDPFRPPPQGDGLFTAANCYGVEFAVANQETADLLAQINSTICQGQQGGGGASPGRLQPQQRVPFYNSPQSASGACSSQSVFTRTVPAASFVIMAFPDQGVGAQAAVDAKALAYAQQSVVNFDFCVGCTNDVGAIKICLGQVYGSTNLFVMRGAAGSVTWSASGLPPGIHLTPGTTTAITDASGDSWVRLGNGRWMNLTSGVTQANQPVGTSSGNTGTADLFGTPTQAGNFTFTVTATAANGNSSTFKGTISVLGFVTTSPLPNGSICALYNLSLQAAGGTAPYTFFDAGIPGPFPNGLTITLGVLHGALGAGAYQFTIGLRDALGQECSQLFLLTIDPSATPPSFTTPAALPNGHANQSYFTPIVVTGGCPSSVAPPYILTVDSGALPFAFQLAYSGGWEILGFPGPGQVGSYAFTLKATDWAGQSVTKPFTLTIDADTVATTTCPSDGSIQATGTVSPGNDINGHPYDQNAQNSRASAAAFNQLAGLGCSICNAQVAVVPRTNGSTPSPNPHGNTWTSACPVFVYVTGIADDFGVKSFNGVIDLYNFISGFVGVPNGVFQIRSGPAGGGILLFSLYF
jgi:hypothetical protein